VDRLSFQDKRLLQAAAVVGKDVPYALLREIAELSEDELRGGLGRLQAAEFIYEARLFPDLEYTFKHALTHEIAYGGVLHERRRALHGAIVDAIERLLGTDRIIEQVERLAHHAVLAEVTPKAVHYLRLAGQKAAARSANREAAAYLEQALALQGTLPETPESLGDALDIRMALGPVLMTVKGASNPEVEKFFDETHELLDRVGNARWRFPLLWAKWRIAYSSGRYAEALERGEVLLESVRRDEDSGARIEAHHTLWPTLFSMGQTQAALVHIERGIALYDRERHAALVSYSGHDAGACCRFHLALARWIGGYPQRALDASKDAMRLAEELHHPLTIMLTAYFAAVVHLMRGERTAGQACVQRVLALCELHAFADWVETARVIACATSDEAPSLAQLAELQEIALRATAWRGTYNLCLLAELYAASSRPDLGRNAIGMIGAAEREGLFGPEIERIEGELCLQQPEPDFAQAERHFRRSIETANGRAARSFELRAAINLARALDLQGHRDAAHAALAGIYGGFTEGFDTLDLRNARGLLERLRA
jgi:tetratricopeptide (TPR) repeat protein